VRILLDPVDSRQLVLRRGVSTVVSQGHRAGDFQLLIVSCRLSTLSPSEWKRKAVHAGMGLFSLTLRWLDWRVAAAIALAALLFNLFVMPRVGRGIYRDPEKKRD